MYPRRLSTLISVLTLSVAAFITPARADWCSAGSNAAYIDLNREANASFGNTCDIASVNGASARIYVRATSIPFQKVRLTIPDVPGVTVVNESWGVSFTGNHATGVELDMGSCVGPFDIWAPTVVGYMDVTWGNPSNCSAWGVSSAEVQDCDGMWRPVYEMEQRVGVNPCGQCPWQLCFGPLAAYDPEPANGATNVPLDVVLKWTFTHDPDRPVSYIRISTAPDCESGGLYWLENLYEFAPDFLEEGRTYYWRALYGQCCDGGCQDTGGVASGPVYSFTTEGVIAVEPSTWGRVKSLYRE